MQVADFALPGLNTAMLFGESAFISFRTLDGEVAHLDKQIGRLIHSAEFLDFETESDLWEDLLQMIEGLKGECTNHYFRVTLFSYLDGSVDFFIWVKPIGKNINTPVTLKSMGVRRPLFFPEVKIGQYAEIFRAGRRGQALYPEYDEILLVSETEDEEIFEAATSNFFCLQDGNLISPSFETGVYKGIFISEFLRSMDEQSMPREIRKLTLKEVKEKQYSCFICNSVKGVRPVTRLDEVDLKCSQKDIDFLNKYLAKVKGYEQIITG